MIDVILKFFPNISDEQRERFEKMMALYPQWNDKINVISRKDIDNLEINHILHSLSIAKFIMFAPGSKILDLGCGGGLPSLPLAVLMPDVNFHLVDRVGKKITVAREIAHALNLRNVSVQHGDSGECKRHEFDFVVSRAVMPLADLIKVSTPLVSGSSRNGYPNGLISLKGGNLETEIAAAHADTLVQSLSTYFPGIEYFDTKVITYTPLCSHNNKKK